MNKTDARRYAKRLIAGYIEELCFARKSDPLVYDSMCNVGDAQGRRLSDNDEARVDAEIEYISSRFYREGYPEICRNPDLRAFYMPDGKPGAKWKKYKQWLKRQGRE